MAWCRPGGKPLSERIYAPLGLNVLKCFNETAIRVDFSCQNDSLFVKNAHHNDALLFVYVTSSNSDDAGHGFLGINMIIFCGWMPWNLDFTNIYALNILLSLPTWSTTTKQPQITASEVQNCFLSREGTELLWIHKQCFNQAVERFIVYIVGAWSLYTLRIVLKWVHLSTHLIKIVLTLKTLFNMVYRNNGIKSWWSVA